MKTYKKPALSVYELEANQMFMASAHEIQSSSDRLNGEAEFD